MAHPCPTCEQSMTAARFGPLGLELCRRCGAAWVEDGGLALLLQGGIGALKRLGTRCKRETATDAEAPDPGVAGKCPICMVPLMSLEYPALPGIQLRGCRFCRSHWLTGECLEQLAEHLARPAGRAGWQPRDGTAAPDTTIETGPSPIGRPHETGAKNLPRNPWEVRATGDKKPGGRVVRADADTERPTCARCGETNTAQAQVCWACGGFLREHVPAACPGCGSRMHRIDSDGIPLAGCEGCGAAWVESESLTDLRYQPGFVQERLVETLNGLRKGRAQALLEALQCPTCRGPLYDEYLGILTVEPIQRCARCGGCFLEQGMLAVVLLGRRK